jgi:hypothetical protein
MVPLQIVTVIAGIILAALKQLYPTIPITEEQIALAITFLLGLFGVVVQFRARTKIRSLNPDGGNVILNSKAFWVMVAGLLSFVVMAFFPDFPIVNLDIAALLLWVLAQFGINPQLRAQGLLK